MPSDLHVREVEGARRRRRAEDELTERQCPARSACTVEISISRPSRMIPTPSQLRSTSGRLCDERKTVRPAALTSDTRARNSRCISGSRPLDGSSRTISGASPMNACTTPTFWRLPRDSLRIWTDGSSSRRSATARQAPFGSPRSRPRSRAAQRGQFAEVRRVAADVRKALVDAAASAHTSSPKIVACPAVGRSSPRSVRIVVVLPAPLGPRNPKTSPSSTANVTSVMPRQLP